MWRRNIIIGVLILLFVGILTAHGAISGVFGFSRGSLVATGDLWGLGADADVTVVGTAQVTALCQSPGGHVAPGRSPISYTAQAWADLVVDENGHASFTLSVADPSLGDVPVSPNPKEAGCPSDSWSVVGVEVRWVAAQVIVNKFTGSGGLNETAVWNFSCSDDGATLTCQ